MKILCTRLTVSFSRISLFATAACLCGAASSVWAVPINYGDKPGATVTYTQVTEDANSFGDAPPLFGPPTVVGDSMDFNPVGFSASSAGGSPADITDGQLNFGIVAKPGKVINTVSFSEAGDTTLAGFGTDNTFTSVTAHLFVDILQVDGVDLGASISLPSVQLVFTPSGGSYGLGTDGGGGPIFTTGWSGSKTINLNNELNLLAIPYVNGVTKVQVALDNTLVATSQDGTSSLIAKKDADGVTITTNIPEPASAWLIVLAGLGGSALRRKS